MGPYPHWEDAVGSACAGGGWSESSPPAPHSELLTLSLVVNVLTSQTKWHRESSFDNVSNARISAPEGKRPPAYGTDTPKRVKSTLLEGHRGSFGPSSHSPGRGDYFKSKSKNESTRNPAFPSVPAVHLSYSSCLDLYFTGSSSPTCEILPTHTGPRHCSAETTHTASLAFSVEPKFPIAASEAAPCGQRALFIRLCYASNCSIPAPGILRYICLLPPLSFPRWMEKFQERQGFQSLQDGALRHAGI